MQQHHFIRCPPGGLCVWALAPPLQPANELPTHLLPLSSSNTLQPPRTRPLYASLPASLPPSFHTTRHHPIPSLRILPAARAACLQPAHKGPPLPPCCSAPACAPPPVSARDLGPALRPPCAWRSQAGPLRAAWRVPARPFLAPPACPLLARPVARSASWSLAASAVLLPKEPCSGCMNLFCTGWAGRRDLLRRPFPPPPSFLPFCSPHFPVCSGFCRPVLTLLRDSANFAAAQRRMSTYCCPLQPGFPLPACAGFPSFLQPPYPRAIDPPPRPDPTLDTFTLPCKFTHPKGVAYSAQGRPAVAVVQSQEGSQCDTAEQARPVGVNTGCDLKGLPTEGPISGAESVPLSGNHQRSGRKATAEPYQAVQACGP